MGPSHWLGQLIRAADGTFRNILEHHPGASASRAKKVGAFEQFWELAGPVDERADGAHDGLAVDPAAIAPWTLKALHLVPPPSPTSCAFVRTNAQRSSFSS